MRTDKKRLLLPIPSFLFSLLFFGPLTFLPFTSNPYHPFICSVSLIVLSLGVIDLLLALFEEVPLISRKLPPLWVVGVKGNYEVLLFNPLRRPLLIEFAEDTLDYMKKLYSVGRIKLQSQAEVTISVNFIAFARGNLGLGSIYLRYPTRLSFWYKSVKLESTDSIRIYPYIRDYIVFDPFQHRRRQFQIGQKKVLIQGEGADFDRLRLYQPGDDYKKINWKATARLYRPVVSVFSAEQNKEIMVLLDRGRHMHADISGRTRFDRFLDAVVQLAYAVQIENDRLGFLLFDDDVRKFFPPRKNRNILSELYDIQPVHIEPDYIRMVRFLNKHFRRRSLILLFTEVGDSLTGERLILALTELVKYGQVTLILLDNPKVLKLSSTPPVDEASFYTHTAALSNLKSKRLLCERIRRMGVDVVRAYSETLNLELVNKYLGYKIARYG